MKKINPTQPRENNFALFSILNQYVRHRGVCYNACKVAIALLSTLVVIGIERPIQATIPEQAKVDEILGDSSELRLRRNGSGELIQVNSILRRFLDDLVTRPPNNARALLRFLSAAGEDLKLTIQTNSHTEPAIYYFPCTVRGGDFLIGWGLQRNESRGCETGLKVESALDALGNDSPVQSLSPTPIYWAERLDGLKHQLAQLRFQRTFYYCSASGSGGAIGFATSRTENPCDRALDTCETSDGSACTVDAMGRWAPDEKQLHATINCLDAEPLSTEGTGATFATNIETLIQSLPPLSQTACTLDIYRPQDFVMVPAPDDVVMAANAGREQTSTAEIPPRESADDAILVQTRDTPTGIEVDVLRGAINVRSNRSPAPQLVTKGQRYRHWSTGNEVTTFDHNARIASIDMEILCAFSAEADRDLNIAACEEAGFDNLDTTGKPITFCNKEQASGGQQGDRRIVQMNSNQGEVELEYEMYTAKDRLDVYYEGQRIGGTNEWDNNGFVSGSARLTIPFSGQSGRLEVVVTGSPDIPTTEWEYTLYCPR